MPNRRVHRQNLTVIVNLAMDKEANFIPPQSQGQSRSSHSDFSWKKNGSLAAQVLSKLEDGDFKGAERVVSSSESIYPPDSRSLDLIKEKYPLSYLDFLVLPAP